MSDAAVARVDLAPPELVRVDYLTGCRAHDLGPREEHLAGAARHDCPIRQRRRVRGRPGTGSENHGDLGNDALRRDVERHDLATSVQRFHPLVDARAAGIV